MVQLVDNYEQQLGIKSFDLIIDWGWFYFITKPLFKVIDYFYRLLGNFGLAILLVTVLLKGLFLPLANKSYASMAKMKAVQPQLKELQERYKDDKAKLQQEMMALYKRERINPVAGCWPMLIQIPVFFALYKVIFTTIEMRQAPFYGWIHDLSAPDPTSVFNLFGLIPFTPPHLLMLGAWPLIMGVTMFVQMKMNPEPPDPAQKMMFTWMPLIFTFMLSSFPAGLVIYWSWNNTLSVLQQGFIMKKHGVKIELWDNLRKLIQGKARPRPRDRVAEASGNAAQDDRIDADALEAGRLLFARECAFRYAAGTIERLPPPGSAGNRFRRALQRRQIEPHQRAHRPPRARPHLAHAGPHPGADLLRARRRSSCSSTCRATATRRRPSRPSRPGQNSRRTICADGAIFTASMFSPMRAMG